MFVHLCFSLQLGAIDGGFETLPTSYSEAQTVTFLKWL